MPTKPLVVDYSALNEYAWCPRAYQRRYVQHLIPADAVVSTSLSFGEAHHQARAMLAETGELAQALAKFDELYTTPYHAEGWDDGVRTPYVGRALIHAYAQKWGLPHDTYTEIGSAIEIDDFIFHGRIDYVADSTVTDLKTTTALIWLPKARLNWQLVGYAFMVQALTPVTPAEVSVDGIIVPRMTKQMKSAVVMPPEAEYALSLHDTCLHRRTASILPADMHNWLMWVRSTVRAIRICLEENFFPMRAPVACSRYNRRCDFEPLCLAASEEVADNLANALYVIQPWTPYDA